MCTNTCGDFIDCEYKKSLLYDKNFTHMFRKGESKWLASY